MKEYIINSKKYGRKIVLLDDEDYYHVISSNIKLRLRRDKCNVFYIVFNTPMVNGIRKTIQIHRWIINCPEGLTVDHINHNPLDNRRCNLRICTQFENNKNKKSNTSGHVGVYFYKQAKKWRAYITYKRKMISLGLFENIEDAIKARLEAEKKYIN